MKSAMIHDQWIKLGSQSFSGEPVPVEKETVSVEQCTPDRRVNILINKFYHMFQMFSRVLYQVSNFSEPSDKPVWPLLSLVVHLQVV